MGCNERLKDSTKILELDKFILTLPLGRGQWMPVGLEMFDCNKGKYNDRSNGGEPNKETKETKTKQKGIH